MLEVIEEHAPVYGLNDCYIPPLPDQQPGYAPFHSNIAAAHPSPELALPLLPTLRPHPDLRMLRLDDSYQVAYVPSRSQVAVLNEDARRLLTHLPLRAPPQDRSIIAALNRFQRLGLLQDAAPSPLQSPVPDVLSVWLHITNACNLNCSYCYINKTRETMDDATARAAIDTAIRSALLHGYRGVALKYAGGEPTLNMPLIERTHSYALEQAAATGLALQGALLSNGTTITPQMVATLQRLHLSLTISLDGLDDHTNMQRTRLNGRSSLAATQRAILQACDAHLTPTIAVTISRHNSPGLPALVRWLLEHHLPFFLSLSRAPERGRTPEQTPADQQQIITDMRRAYDVIRQHPPRWSVLSSVLDRVDIARPHQHACAMGSHYLVIDQRGQIAQCQMTLAAPVASVAHADPLSLIRANTAGVPNLPVEQKPACRSCEWRYWCAGGCPVAAYQASRRGDAPSPHCHIYRSLFPDVLYLEGWRRLHWYRQPAAYIWNNSRASQVTFPTGFPLTAEQ